MHVRKLTALGLLALSVGCGGRSLEKEFRKHPSRVLPQGVSQVLYARVDQLQRDPLAVLAFERIGEIQWGRTMQGIAQTLRLAGTIEDMVVGTYGGGPKEMPSAVLVGTGKFGEDAFVDGMESAKIPHIEGKYGNRRIYTCGRGDERCYVCFSAEGLLIAASREQLLKQVLDLGDGKGKSLARDQGFQPLLESYSAGLDLWATGAFPVAMLTSAVGFPPDSPIQLIQAFTIKLSGRDPKELNVVLHCLSPEAAEANAEMLKSIVGQLSTQVRMMGYAIDDLLAAINRSQIVVDGATTDYLLPLTKDEIAATAEALRAGPTAPPTLLDRLGPTPGTPLPPASGPPRSP